MKRLFASLMLTIPLLLATGCSAPSGPKAGMTADTPAQFHTYLLAAYVPMDEMEAKLKDAGFEVLATHNPAKNKKQHVIIVTNDELKTLAAKPMRGHAAILRVMVDDEAKKVQAQNPEYFLRAFLQDDYVAGMGNKTEAMMKKALGATTFSTDFLETDRLAHYRFMIGRPYYEDMITVVKEGATAEDMLKTYRHSKDGKKGEIAVLKLADDKYLIMHNMGKRTEKFVKKIDTPNEVLLPWTILIEGNKASALRADYYVAVSYPLLAMMDFAKIMTLPGSVDKLYTKMFK